MTVGNTEALAWGDGDRGVVLAHGAAYDAASWETQAEKIAESGATVLAVEDTSAGGVRAAADHLKSERGARSVCLVGASAGSSGVLDVGRRSPGEVAQIVLLSGSGDVSGLGDYPKLFAASEGEGIAERVRRMAEQAPGDRNEALIVGGDARAQAIFDTPQGDRLLRTVSSRGCAGTVGPGARRPRGPRPAERSAEARAWYRTTP
ncbi:MAG: alpha/beta hydrolase [Actinomycetota bacterium]|nr:alpha/beta hydrolase [Actinomycetota bacterium]